MVSLDFHFTVFLSKFKFAMIIVSQLLCNLVVLAFI